MNENVLLKKLQAGSREALELLWKFHSENVLNLAFRMLKDRDEAEDILMDIFVSIPSAIKKFRGDSALGTWLYRLTVNACLMKLRAQKRHGELEAEHIDFIREECLGHTDVKIDYDPEILEKGLSQLPAETRSMLWLKDAEDLNIKELVDIYGIPEGTVKAKLSRARHLVKNYIHTFLGRN